MTELKWFTKFTAGEDDTPSPITGISPKDLHKVTLKGILIDDTANKNMWCVEEEDFESLAKDFIGKQIRTDHAEHVSQVIGVVRNTEIDGPHSEAKSDWDIANEHPHIHFLAEMATVDNNLIIPIKMGYVNSVSPAVDARTILCSECRTPMQPVGNTFIKACKCEEGVKLLKDITARELSVVCSPAYAGTTMVPYGFAAAVNDSLMDENRLLEVVNDELTKRIHTSL